MYGMQALSFGAFERLWQRPRVSARVLGFANLDSSG
jgi:hypothetical protein